MRDKLCIVLCNLKPKNLGGLIESHGMVLCAENPDRTVAELLQPAEGSQAGDVVTIAGFERKPIAEIAGKKNPWENTSAKFKIDEDGFAIWDTIKLTTEKGPVKSQTIKSGVIH